MKTVHIVSPSHPGLAKITDAETGDELKGVVSVDWHISAARDDPGPQLTLTIFSASVDVRGQAVFMVSDPRSGKLKRVRRIEFEDGSEFSGGYSVTETTCIGSEWAMYEDLHAVATAGAK